MTETISLPTPDGDREFDLDIWRPVRSSTLNAGEQMEMRIPHNYEEPFPAYKEYAVIDLPYYVAAALIDATQHPVCPVCKERIFANKYTDNSSSHDTCGCFNPNCFYKHWVYIPRNHAIINNAFGFKLFPKFILEQPELLAAAIVRHPIVIWQWLESLKKSE